MFESGNDEDQIHFINEPEAKCAVSNLVWRILIVDDEPDVHSATLLAMKGVAVEGRNLEFVHAYSAAEARSCLQQFPDIAIVLLDVVMESNDAGLQLVHYLRKELHNDTVRIILRTGQPGYAPEIETIRAYDINDYKTKTELTQERLYSSIAVAVRSYWQTYQLDTNRRGLEMILAASNKLSKPQGTQQLAAGLVTQLCALLRMDEEGLVCAAEALPGRPPYILAAAGRYAQWICQPLEEIPSARVRSELERTLNERQHRFELSTCLYFCVKEQHAIVAFVDVDHPLSDQERRLLEVFCSNIAVAFENSYLYQRISDIAYEDQLLSLPNRNAFLLSIENRSDDSEVMALVDLDGFADINSILDEDFGDLVLQAVAARLRQIFDPTVVLARIGGDTFGLLGSIANVNQEKIMTVFASPFEVSGESLRLSATSGLVRLSDLAVGAAELLKNAGVALKQAKHFNRGKALFFEPEFADEARSRMQLLSRLRLAFSADRLFCAYQPIVNLRSGKIVGAEALLRWRTEQGEFVAPDQFISIAEQSGLMVPLGEWVLRNALEYLQRLISSGHTGFKMAINVSHVQFREPDFVAKVFALLREYDIAPLNVQLELTESVAMDNIETIAAKIAAIQAAGISISIDDFGTGYSSLSVVRKLKVDCLKIDRSFISGDNEQSDGYSIAGMVLSLAKTLNVKTTAEGIETEEQFQRMRKMGCTNGQGFLFAPALPDDQFEIFLCDHATGNKWPFTIED